MATLPWLWIPITLGAAAAQTVRNAAQRGLMPELGTLGATLVRFLYGLPFAVLWMALLRVATGEPLPAPNAVFLAWTVGGSAVHAFGTALLLKVMEMRSFAIGVAYSKTEVIQVGIFGLVLLGDPLTPAVAAATLLATLGVVLVSVPRGGRLDEGWLSTSALLGIVAAACFAIASASYRGAALALAPTGLATAAAFTLVVSIATQTLIIGLWLALQRPETAMKVLRAWRQSLGAGFAGALASVLWYTAMALEPVVHVRTVAVTELIFGWIVSRRFMREQISRREIVGMVLLGIGAAGVAALS